MTNDEFWDHIRATRRKDSDAHVERLIARLAKRPGEDIIDFEAIWNDCERRAYDWNLWGAAYLMNGGCSDDGFHYFCGWLVLQGRDVFERAVADPNTLADLADPDEVAYEAYPDSIAVAAHVRKTGGDRERTDADYDAWDKLVSARHPDRRPLPDLGDMWDHDDDAEVRRRLPRLAALYLDRE